MADNGVDNFRPVFKYYKSRQPRPDLSSVLAVEHGQEGVASLSPAPQPPTVCHRCCQSAGLKPPQQWRVFAFANNPGLLVIRNPFTPAGQRLWIVKCLTEYPDPPNVNNITNIVQKTQQRSVTQEGRQPQCLSSDSKPVGAFGGEVGPGNNASSLDGVRTSIGLSLSGSNQHCVATSNGEISSPSNVGCRSELSSIPSPDTNQVESAPVSLGLKNDRQALVGKSVDGESPGLSWWQEVLESEGVKTEICQKLRWATLGYHHDWDTKHYSPEKYTPIPPCMANLTATLARGLTLFLPSDTHEKDHANGDQIGRLSGSEAANGDQTKRPSGSQAANGDQIGRPSGSVAPPSISHSTVTPLVDCSSTASSVPRDAYSQRNGCVDSPRGNSSSNAPPITSVNINSISSSSTVDDSNNARLSDLESNTPSSLSANSNTLSSLKANSNTPSPLSANSNTPSPLSANSNTPSPLSANSNTPSPLSANSNTPSPLSANSNTPSPLSANSNTPSPLSANSNTPSSLSANSNTPSSLSANGNTPSSLSANSNTPSPLSANSNTPSSLSVNSNTPSSAALATTPSSCATTNPLSPVCPAITRTQLQQFRAEAAIVNYYHPGTTLSPHTDVSEPNREAPLFSISFGQPCVFLVGGPSRSIPPTPIGLHSGDVVVMGGAARLAFHAVPLVTSLDQWQALAGVMDGQQEPWRLAHDTEPGEGCWGQVKEVENGKNVMCIANEGDSRVERNENSLSRDNCESKLPGSECEQMCCINGAECLRNCTKYVKAFSGVKKGIDEKDAGVLLKGKRSNESIEHFTEHLSEDGTKRSRMDQDCETWSSLPHENNLCEHQVKNISDGELFNEHKPFSESERVALLEYISANRINMNIRQVCKAGEVSLRSRNDS